MTFPRQTGKGSDRTSLAENALAGGIILLGGLLCVGLILFLVNGVADHNSLRASADALLNDLDSGRIESAYARTTRNFQSVQSLKQFHGMVGPSPGFRSRGSRSISRVKVSKEAAGPTGVVQARVGDTHFPSWITLVLAREDGEWKIDRWFDSWD